MSFELDIGHTSQAGRNEVNEDFAALLQGQGRDRERGAIAAIADGVSTGGKGREGGFQPRPAPKQRQSPQRDELERPVPQRKLQHAVQADYRQNAPCQLAHRVGFCPGACAPHPP